MTDQLPTRPRRQMSGGVALGLLAAATFGASTPFAKRLLDHVRPEMLAGLLYLGAFLALMVFRPLRRNRHEAPLRRSDAPRLAGLVVTGGVLAPVVMLLGLDRVSGASGALLLNLEGPFTLIVAVVIFREHLDRRALVGALAVFGGAALLTSGGANGTDTVAGVLLVALAGLLWAIDNNITQSLTEHDPYSIVSVKTGVAAAINLGIAMTIGNSELPSVRILGLTLLVGAVSYGLSVLLDAYALRELGAAREATIFATAPFIGLALSMPVLGHRPTVGELAAAFVMGAGVTLLVRERHAHVHTHLPLDHDHRHVHDEHHQHGHADGTDLSVPHAHVHHHQPLTHAHGHVSDAHHRHDH